MKNLSDHIVRLWKTDASVPLVWKIPRFLPQDQTELNEGDAAHFDCRVEPASDPDMRIDWFFNGRPFATGSRVHQLSDFGFIVLDLNYTYARDSGEYMCRATNKWGTATTKATLTCKCKCSLRNHRTSFSNVA